MHMVFFAVSVVLPTELNQINKLSLLSKYQNCLISVYRLQYYVLLNEIYL